MNILNLSRIDLEEYLIKNNYKKYVSNQIYEWLYKHRVTSFDLMTNLKKDLITKLEEEFQIRELELVLVETGDNVYKFLFNLSDNSKIEAVLMIQEYGNSLCISTQVGCNMGCLFCESGKLKRVRNLTPSEMIEQYLFIEEYLNIRISHVVMMGIGEPFDNYDNVMKFVDIINDPKGLELGSRHITISTCGIVPKIKEFAKEPKQVNLAISLHASNNEIRNKLMKINKTYDIKEVIDSIREYIKVTNRRVTIEYIMLDHINDSKENAIELAQLLKGMNVYVNLIPYNETSADSLKRSSKTRTLEFYDTLKKNKTNVTIRKEFGSNLSAACGQLSSKYEEE